MPWFKRLLSPQNQPFIIYALLLVAFLVGALFYTGMIHRRHLAHLAAAARRALTDQTEVPQLKMERSSLEFELPSLKSHHPVLTNETTGEWTQAAATSFLYPDVRRTWKAWWDQAQPLVLQPHPNLAAFAALQEAYAADVDRLASDITIADKPAALEELRQTKFATLFESATYLGDRAQFDTASQNLADPAVALRRRDYYAALVAAATNLNPRLAEYGAALLRVESRSVEIRIRLNQLNEQLAGLGEIQNSPEAPAPRTGVVAAAEQLFGSDSPLAAAFRKSDFLTVGLAAMVICFLITMPLELRDRRWLKIAASAVLVCVGMLTLQVPLSLKLSERAQNVFPFLAYLIPAVLLAALWTPSLCFWGARLFTSLIDSTGSDEPDFSTLGPAYSALRQGDAREALRWIKPHLVSSDRQYEALLLKARLHRRLNNRRRAQWPLKRALRLRNLTDKQRHYLADLLAHLDDPSHPGWQL